jgi:hypothetical protein
MADEVGQKGIYGDENFMKHLMRIVVSSFRTTTVWILA